MMKINFSTSLFVMALAVGASGCDRETSKAMSSDMDDESSVSNSAEPCSTLAGNAKDICEKEAEGRKWIDAAELAANREPSAQHDYELRIAKADALIGVAKERCDDLSGNPEDVCRQEAERNFETAKADATLQLKLSEADAVARKTTNEANKEAAESSEEAREDADDVKHEAALSVAKEKCDRFANDERSDCIASAEAAYAKN
jgi:hypothetical protein